MITVADLWRHPIKGVGREQLRAVALRAGQCLPYDRHWAIAHEDADLGDAADGWARCGNFARAARGPKLMAVASVFNEDTGALTLSHPDLPDITVDPDREGPALVDWVAQISDPRRAMPAKIVKPARGMTDSSDPTVSIQSLASLDRLSKAVGQPLDQRRFRGNIWLDGPKAFEEFDWSGKLLRIGQAEIEILEPIERCKATTVNPDTGAVDANTLGTLNAAFGHQNFGVYGMVRQAGMIAIGDVAEILG
ncbi:MAG: MOSC N-terminal beta barrel domain-containing protein [Pseudomonadota bacterium]